MSRNKKIDLHLHLMSEPSVHTVKAMISHLQSLGIEKAVLMSGGEKPNKFGTNDEMMEICRKYPDSFVWMCNLDEEDIDTVYERMKACKENGAIGVGELIINRRIDHPFLDSVFRSAASLGLPVTIHMSPEEGYKYGVVDEPGLPLLEQLLQKYPNLKILGHSQTFWIEISKDSPTKKELRYKTGKGPVVPGGRLIELFEKYPNLYGDLSAGSGGQAIMRDPVFGIRFLETYADRLFFATDTVHIEHIYPLGAWLDEQLEEGKLSQKTYDKICFQNAEKIFRISYKEDEL